MSDFSKLLDNGYSLVLFKNALGSYSCMVVGVPCGADIDNADNLGLLTDHHTPEQAIKQLTDKVLHTGKYSPPDTHSGDSN